MVLLPGLDGTGQLFRPLVAALSRDLRPTVIGYPPHQPLGLAELASLVLKRLPPEKVILLAESFSGLVALTLLANAPSRFRGVILVGAFAEPPRPMLLRLAPLASRGAGLMRSAPAFLLRQFCLGSDAAAADLAMLRDALASVSSAVLTQRLQSRATLSARRRSRCRRITSVPGRIAWCRLRRRTGSASASSNVISRRSTARTF